ncbi:MAG: GAP family protein [Aeromicrobium sp.]
MIELIAELVPPALGIAFSPLPLVAVVLMILSPDGRGRSIGFAAGRVVAVLLVVAVVASLAELVTKGEDGSRIGAIVRLVLGSALIVFAVSKVRSRPKAGDEPKVPGWMQAIDKMTPGKALGTGFLVSAVNPKELIFGLAAGVVVGSAPVPFGQMAVTIVAYVVIATITVVVPVLAYLILGDRVRGWLEPPRAWLVRQYPVIIAVVLSVLGVVMFSNGLAYF